MDLQDNRGPLILRAIYPLSALATLAVIGRFLSRKIMKMSWEIDDYAIVVALLLTWACTVSITFAVHYGGGRHIQALSKSEIVHFLKSTYALNEIYIATPAAIKIAALLMYKRIFNTAKFRYRANWFIAFVCVWWFAETIAAVFLCLPVAGFWNKSIKAKCVSLRNFDIGYAVVNITVDVVILSLPLRMIWHLKIKLAQKIALTFVFLIGALECVMALIRLLSSILDISDPDLTWVVTNGFIWTTAEPAVGVMAVCLITLRPLLSYLFPTHFSSTGSGNSKTKASHPPTGTNLNAWRTDGSFKRLQEQNSQATGVSDSTVTDNEGPEERLGSGTMEQHERRIRVTTELELQSRDRTP